MKKWGCGTSLHPKGARGAPGAPKSSKIDEISIPVPLENPRETCIAKGTPKVIKDDVENPSIWRSSKNQLFDSHNDHYLDTSESLNSQRILYNKGSLKNVRLEEENELGTCTAQHCQL